MSETKTKLPVEDQYADLAQIITKHVNDTFPGDVPQFDIGVVNSQFQNYRYVEVRFDCDYDVGTMYERVRSAVRTARPKMFNFHVRRPNDPPLSGIPEAGPA